MVTHDEILQALRAWIADGRTRSADIARELGLPSPRVSEILKGRRKIQPREMPILARYLELEDDPASGVRRIKRIGQVPAGDIRQALAETTDTIEVSANLPKGVFALEVDGESMNQVAPYDADVIVDPADKQLFAGDFYVIGDNQGAFTFKLFLQDPARLVPLSDDPAHKIIQLGDEPIQIVGRVVSVQLGAATLRRMGQRLQPS